jgi:phage host-nuclease inhibitor protein Gam
VPALTDRPELPGQISLDDYLNMEFDAQMEGEVEVTVSGDTEAAWTMRKLATLVKARNANEAIADAEVRKISNWLTEVQTPLTNQIKFFTDVLEKYAAHEREAGGRKTISLPHGKITTRPLNDKWEVADKDAFIAWAKTSGIADLFKVKEEPALTVIKSARKDDGETGVVTLQGEVVPGLSFTKGDGFSVTVTPAP